ncbi:MAG: DnaB-like helicase C-terminal domain-containing protein [Candidatus Omnitrophota bacterium]
MTVEVYEAKGDKGDGIFTGFKGLDILTGGLKKGDVTVIAGRPSLGKSALALSILEHVGAKDKIPCVYFSLELPRNQLTERMLSSMSGVDINKIRSGFLSKTEWPKLVSTAGRISGESIFIDDTPGITALEIKEKARSLKAEHDIKLIIVDYLQLVSGESSSGSRRQKMSDISREIRAIATELDVPVIVTSQLSRAAERREDHRPHLSDLGYSAGNIERFADHVWFLVREEYYNPNEKNAGEAEIILAKNRRGPTGSIMLRFSRGTASFSDVPVSL